MSYCAVGIYSAAAILRIRIAVIPTTTRGVEVFVSNFSTSLNAPNSQLSFAASPLERVNSNAALMVTEATRQRSFLHALPMLFCRPCIFAVVNQRYRYECRYCQCNGKRQYRVFSVEKFWRRICLAFWCAGSWLNSNSNKQTWLVPKPTPVRSRMYFYIVISRNCKKFGTLKHASIGTVRPANATQCQPVALRNRKPSIGKWACRSPPDQSCLTPDSTGDWILANCQNVVPKFKIFIPYNQILISTTCQSQGYRQVISIFNCW